VDCIVDTGLELIPIEIKAGEKVKLSDVRGLASFIDLYGSQIKNAYVITNGRLPEKLNSKITAVPWKFI